MTGVRASIYRFTRKLRGEKPANSGQSNVATAANAGLTSTPVTRKAARLRAAASAEGARYVVAQEAYVADWSGVRNQHGAQVEFAVTLPTRIPELGYGVFADARVLSRAGYPVTSDGHLLIDAINVNGIAKFRTYGRPMALAPAVELEGLTVNLATVFSTNNYGHALIDGLGRLGLLAEAGFDVASTDHVILPAFPSTTIRQLALLAGFREEALINPAIGAHFACERLVQTTFPGRPRVYSPAPGQFMRGLGIEPSGNARRLLLLREGDKRTIVNGDEVAAIARDYGFELYDPKASQFSPADFAGAELVVGAHGAGLSDIGFCAPGTRVIEFSPSGHRYPYFATLAVSSGLKYTALECQSVSGERHADFVVDVAVLRRLLDSTQA